MRVWLVVLLAVASNAFAEPREMSWRALDVKARLDAEGRLHVKERHSMVFTGDWNGGERKFNVRRGQELTLTGMSRIDQWTEVASPMQQGNLDEVDQFAWSDATTLRWRSRSPGDPEFVRTVLVYDIAYTIVPVVARTTRGLFLGEPQYRLDHDFAFPDRPAAIERFTLRLDLDPGWQGHNPFTNVIAGPLQSGQSYVAHLPLEFRGAVAPAALPWFQSRVAFDLLWPLLLGVTLLAVLLFLIREHAAGRFDRAAASRVDESWLQENILTHPPEVVGALWDEEVGSAEIAAVLARMTDERKIMTMELGGSGGLSFTLKVPVSSLPETDRSVVEALFQTEQVTNTTEIASTGKGAMAIAAAEPSIMLDVQTAFPKLEQAGRRFPAVGNLLTTAGNVLFFVALYQNLNWFFTFAVPGIVALLLYQTAMKGARRWRSAVQPNVLHALHLVGPLGIAFLFALSVLRGRLPFSAGRAMEDLGLIVETLSGLLPAAAAFVLISVGMFSNALRVAAAAGGRERLRVRRDLAAARQYFVDQLRLRSPSLNDAWYPYLLAFGLAPSVEDWFRSFGDAPEGDRNRSRSSSSGGTSHSAPSTPSSPARWTGGGGGFGGAGATASWAAATSALASTGPSSSSGGSSSSSSGGSSSSSSSSSSSGGGGGGGW
ncbi:MAG: hypothetical protein ABIO78_02560 [Thermoanaerobaculia bacterium]